MDCDVTIHWTKTAAKCLLALPAKVRQGLVAKIEALRKSDPRQAGKPLVGPFQGYRRVVYSRYRAIFSVTEEKYAAGATRVTIKVIVVAAGIRKERDKKDIYQVAKKLLELGLIPPLDADKDDA